MQTIVVLPLVSPPPDGRSVVASPSSHTLTYPNFSYNRNAGRFLPSTYR
jgi:hypothetical protein